MLLTLLIFQTISGQYQSEMVHFGGFCTGNHSGYDVFSIMLTIPDIVVTLSLPKPAVTPIINRLGKTVIPSLRLQRTRF